MSNGRPKEQRMQAKAGELRNQSNDQLLRIINDMKLETAQTYGLMGKSRANNAGRNGGVLVAPENNFRRKVIARCLTILAERGVKV